jgi:hypothetical protein
MGVDRADRVAAAMQIEHGALGIAAGRVHPFGRHAARLHGFALRVGGGRGTRPSSRNARGPRRSPGTAGAGRERSRVIRLSSWATVMVSSSQACRLAWPRTLQRETRHDDRSPRGQDRRVRRRRVEYLRHGDKPLLARIYKPRGAGPFPAMVECHGGAWCHERPPHREAASPVHGLARRRVDRARLPLGQRGPVSRLGAGHQLRGALGQGQRARAQDPPRPHRPVGPVERRPSRHAGRHAPERCALFGDPAARRLTGAGCERALRDHVLAGHQPAQPLPPRQARRGERQSAALAEVDHRPPRFLLAIGSQHVRGQPDDGARARREAADAAGGLVPGRNDTCTTTRTSSRASTATSRSASAPTTARPAARSRSSTSTWTAEPARRICRRPATCSTAWSRSCKKT